MYMVSTDLRCPLDTHIHKTWEYGESWIKQVKKVKKVSSLNEYCSVDEEEIQV